MFSAGLQRLSLGCLNGELPDWLENPLASFCASVAAVCVGGISFVHELVERLTWLLSLPFTNFELRAKIQNIFEWCSTFLPHEETWRE